MPSSGFLTPLGKSSQGVPRCCLCEEWNHRPNFWHLTCWGLGVRRHPPFKIIWGMSIHGCLCGRRPEVLTPTRCQQSLLQYSLRAWAFYWSPDDRWRIQSPWTPSSILYFSMMKESVLSGPGCCSFQIPVSAFHLSRFRAAPLGRLLDFIRQPPVGEHVEWHDIQVHMPLGAGGIRLKSEGSGTRPNSIVPKIRKLEHLNAPHCTCGHCMIPFGM